MSNEIKVQYDGDGNIVFNKIHYEDNQILEADHMNRVEAYFEDIYGILNAKPVISTDPVVYTSLGSDVYLDFSIEARGDVIVTIKRGANILYSRKTATRHFHELVATKTTKVEDVEYTIEVQDNLSNSTQTVVINKIIDAHVQLETPITQDLIIGYDMNSTANLELADNDIVFSIAGQQPYSYSLWQKIDNQDWQQIRDVTPTVEEGGNNTYFYNYSIPEIELDTNVQANRAGMVQFEVRLQLAEQADTISTSPLVLNYYLVQNDTIDIVILNDINAFTSNDRFTVKYKAIAANTETFEHLKAVITPNNYIAEQYQVAMNRAYSLSFGILPKGEYTLDWYINDTVIEQSRFKIEEGIQYATKGLLAYFNATSYQDTETHWRAIDGDLKETVSFSLHGGYKHEVTKGDKPNRLILAPNGYGKLENISALTSTLSQEFSFEFYFYAHNIGELKAPVFTTSTEADQSTHLNILHDIASIAYSGIECSTNLLNNKWNHVVLELVNGADATQAVTIEDTEYYKCFKIYLNGCVVACKHLSFDLQWSNQFKDITQFILNGYLNNDIIDKSGQTEYELVRIYNRALKASEVLLNYKNAISYNQELLADVNDRNNNTDIAKIFFIKNQTPIQNDQKIKAAKGYIDFTRLHTITKKKKEREEETGYFSKTSAVNCTAFLIQGDTITKYPNMDVLLQGTSSLVYPVKNYQIKNYSTPGAKERFLPIVQEVDNNTGEGWGGPEGDYVYTLKCDYMEQSHRNNTPTAIYYDSVLNAVIGTNTNSAELYSPPKQLAQVEEVAKYRDSITGFPILVYYSNNDDAKIDLTQYDSTTEGLEFNLLEQCTPTGSYMFNIDKEGKALGFELEDISEEEHTFNFALEDYYISEATINAATDSSTLFDIEFEDELPSYSTIDELNALQLHLYCYGYVYETEDEEGEKIEHTEQQCWLQDCGIITFGDNTETLSVNTDLTGLTPLCISRVKEVVRPTTGYCMSLEGTANSQDYAAATFYTINEANRAIKEYNEEPNRTEEEKKDIYTDKLKYYSTTLEPRYSYADELDYDDERRMCCEYEQLDECIKFFKIVATNKAGVSNTALQQRFEQLFSKEYCLTYYLQMMVFTQVDNAGKNAMFDSWSGSKLYPRPYDMDTQMGLDNVGADNVPVSAELFNSAIAADASLSVSLNYRYQGEGKAVDLNEQRLTSYNTRNSRLWDFVRTKYYSDIAHLYNTLRTNNIYTETNICTTIDHLTSKLISESQYNQDAVLKYLLPPKPDTDDDGKIKTDEEGNVIMKPNTDYFYVLAGNRADRYRQYIRQRLVFLDSVYERGGYIARLDLRAEASTPNNTITWQISTLSPQYVSILSGQNSTAFKFYVTPDMECVIQDNEDVSKRVYGEGIKLSYTNLSTNRETSIYGVNNIKFIEGLGSAAPSTLKGLTNATKLNSFDLVSAPTALTNIDLSTNTFLNSVLIEQCQGVTNLSLEQATNLKTVEVKNNYKLQSLILPEGAPLTLLDLTNSTALQSLTLTNLPNLTDKNLILSGCNSLTSLTIDNCPLLSNINLANLPKLKNLTIKNCKTLINLESEEHPSLTSLIIEDCPNLQRIYFPKCKFSSLDLSQGNTGLRVVHLANNELLTTLYLPHADTTKPDITVDNYHELNQLNLGYCSRLLKVNSNQNNTYDFSGIIITTPENIESSSELGVLRCRDNTSLHVVKNLHYNGSGYNIFKNCSNLTTIENSSFTFAGSLFDAFQNCSKLESITYTNPWAMDSNYPVTTMQQMCQNCYKFPLNLQENIIDVFVKGNANLTSLSGAFMNYQIRQEPRGEWEMDSDAFDGCTNLSSIASAFANSGLKQFRGDNISGGETKYAFSECLKLQNISGAFTSNSLSTIPLKLFVNCSKITNASYAFSNNQNLTTIPSTLFYTQTDKLNIDGLFARCGITNESSSGSSTPINTFFKNHPNITSAIYTFGENPIKKLESGIFDNSINLANADGLFANCNYNDFVNIDNFTFISNNTEILNKTRTDISLSGIFYNWTKLRGILNANIFAGLKQYITSLGLSTYAASRGLSYHNAVLLGAFANTNISGYQTSTFQNLDKLTDISYLFAQANVKAEIIKDTVNLQYTITNNTEFWTTPEGGAQITPPFKGLNATDQLSYTIFNGCKSIDNVIGAFMCTNITDIEQPLDTTVALNLFGDQTSSITDISGIFNNTPLVNNNTATIKALIANLPNVSYAQYAFANTNINDEIVAELANLTKLVDIKGICAGCKQITTVPQNLFAKSAATLRCTDYAFANSGITAIGENTPQVYMLTNQENIYSTFKLAVDTEADSSKTLYVLQNDEEQLYIAEGTYEDARIVRTIAQDSSKQVRIYYTNDEYDDFPNINVIEATIYLATTVNTADKYNIYGIRLENMGSTQSDLLFTTNELVTISPTQYSMILQRVEDIGMYTYVLSSADNNLFNNCVALESTKGMFMNTNNLSTLPSYIFNSASPLTALTNISYMFTNCGNIGTTGANDIIIDKTSLIPTTWLRDCPSIQKISGLFYGLGKSAQNPNSYVLGEAFNTLSNISHADYAFAQIPTLINKSIINSTFMTKSLGQLTQCWGLFAQSNLLGVIEPFKNGLIGNNIANLNYGFTGCLFQPIGDMINLTLPQRSQFPNSLTAQYAWAQSEFSAQDARGWLSSQYTFGNLTAESRAALFAELQANINNDITDNTKQSSYELVTVEEQTA